MSRRKVSRTTPRRGSVAGTGSNLLAGSPQLLCASTYLGSAGKLLDGVLDDDSDDDIFNVFKSGELRGKSMKVRKAAKVRRGPR